jgi:hypothetical protein
MKKASFCFCFISENVNKTAKNTVKRSVDYTTKGLKSLVDYTTKHFDFSIEYEFWVDYTTIFSIVNYSTKNLFLFCFVLFWVDYTTKKVRCC